MPQFFISRPIFAWVVAMFIVLAGLLALPRLPVAQYPPVAPPSVMIWATYPGATPETLDTAVVGLLEREIASVKNLLSFQSSSRSSGEVAITVSFQPGTDPQMAMVDVQNRLKAVEPRLPGPVRQTGLQVIDASNSFLMIVGGYSPNGQADTTALADYFARNVADELRRTPGVGGVQEWVAERAMRVWIDPVKLAGYGLAATDVTNAIEAQNAQVSPGRLGDLPNLPGQQITANIIAEGQLTTPEAFRQIVLRANPDGSRVLLGDVARVELGPQNLMSTARYNGEQTTAMGVQLASGANALRTSQLIRERMEELGKGFPPSIGWRIPYDTAPFVEISIRKVLETLAEAMALVFLVMFLFLQNVRYTFIPAIVAPTALLGACAVILAAGYSINMLTLFGMVLAIGIVVDDAIVVVEAVERIMSREGLSPLEAARKAMREITGAIIGITLVLAAVFIPMAFASGSVGVIYRQFAVAMAAAILTSAFLALSLTPALCATMLKPVGPHPRARGPLGWFNHRFERMNQGYVTLLGRGLGRPKVMMLGFAAILVVLVGLFVRLPGSFLPVEDQGFVVASVMLPPDATRQRTMKVVEALEKHYASRPSVRAVSMFPGFHFTGSGQSVAIGWVALKDWGDRPDHTTAQKEAELANQFTFANIKEGMVFSMVPPAVAELGNSSGFSGQLQDRSGRGYAAHLDALYRLMGLAAQDPALANLRPDEQGDAPRVRVEIDRQKADALGVSFTEISAALSTAFGSDYVNDFPNQGRMQQVIVQADADRRMQVEDIGRLFVRNGAGEIVPLSSIANVRWERGPLQLSRYNGQPALGISGEPKPGKSTGEAMAAMERLTAQLGPGYSIEWTGQSYQERLAGGEAPLLLGLSLLVVFLVLAALYESWSIPLSVILVVPLGVLGAVLAVTLRGLPNDVFFRVGLITIIGLSAKNAVLIIEYARTLYAEGLSASEAALEAAKLRFRPILMTSTAFILGVTPLVLASGASSATQQAIGTGVFGGMIMATALAVFFAPVFFVVVQGMAARLRKRSRRAEAPAE